MTRGVARGISWSALVRIALVRDLHDRLGCSVRQALELATQLLASPTNSIPLEGAVTLGFDRQSFERILQSRLAEALEAAPRPRRGRPPSRAGRAD
jgi:hypothetical protein